MAMRALVLIALSGAMLAETNVPSQAQSSQKQQVKRGPSGLPLPRFVSLKSSRVNMRVGPGTDYAVEWLYLKQGLPMEIIQEYDNWRRVRDADGVEGWINQALLSGRRTGIVAPWFKGKQAPLPLLLQPEEGARHMVEIEPGAIGEIESCNGQWCRMSFSGHEGWIRQGVVWGVYPDEQIDD